MRSLFSHVAVGLLTAIAMLFIFSMIQRHEMQSTDNVTLNAKVATNAAEEIKTATAATALHNYQPRTFDFTTIHGLTKSQLEQHEKLYQGYVKKRNEIEKALHQVNKDEVAASYAPFRSLKVAETFSFNGALLHELYFDNLGGTQKEMGPKTRALLTKNFGSVDAFKKDILATAGCARGWVMTGFCIADNSVANFLLDAHNETVPVLVLPILMIDTYEHAYMIDFGINRPEYLKVMWDNINWLVVEERVEKWVNKFYQQ